MAISRISVARWGLLAALIVTLLTMPVRLVPAHAQQPALATAPAAPTAVVPTPTPTKTTAELIGVGPQVDTATELWLRYRWWALGILALIGIVAVLGSYGAGMLDAVKKRGEKAGEQSFAALDRAGARGGQRRGIAAYLDWLRAEYGWTQQLGIGPSRCNSISGASMCHCGW